LARRQRTPPCTDELKKMLREHLSFEIGRFRQGVSFWYQPGDGVAEGMLRESCLIHVRLLLDFFYPRVEPKDSKYEDVFVFDYFQGDASISEDLAELLKAPPWLQRYRDQLDWRLAHLTLKRLGFDRPPSSVWRPAEQFNHLERLIKLFVQALPPDMRRFFDDRTR
jgi:hypothetical protein